MSNMSNTTDTPEWVTAMRYYRGLEPQRLPLAPRPVPLGLGAVLYAVAIAALALATIAVLIDTIV